jgi:hypothetical protein
MNAQDLMKIAGVKSEKDFYSMFPTEEAFFEAYPQTMQYKKGGKIKKKKQDPAFGKREFPPNVMQMGGSIGANYDSGFTAPEQEAQFNVTNPAKRTGQVMSKGENVGWTALKVVADATKFIHGQDVDPGKMTGKVNPYNGQQGTWWESAGGNTEMPQFAQDKIQGAINNRDTDVNPSGVVAGAGAGAAGAAAGASIGNPMRNKYGGFLKMNMGGMIPGTNVMNSPEQFGTTLRQYGGDIKNNYDSKYIVPTEEASYNLDNMAKFDEPTVMTPGENVGWTVADIVTSPVSSFTGQNLSELGSNKVNPYNNKDGSWWGGIEGTYVKPAVQGFLAESGIPYVSQAAGLGRDVRNMVAPMVTDDSERLATQQAMGNLGAGVGGMMSGMMKGKEDEEDDTEPVNIKKISFGNQIFSKN